jgi:tetratricopeptide (TPR) repeat protein
MSELIVTGSAADRDQATGRCRPARAFKTDHFALLLEISRRLERRLGRPPSLLTLLFLLLLLAGAFLLGKPLLAQHHLRAARTLLDRYHSSEARPHLEACLRLQPENKEALLLLARASRRDDLLDAAAGYLDEYKQRHGQTEAWVFEQILQSAARGESEKVGQYCRTMVEEENPDAPLILEAMTQGYFRMYRLTEGFGTLQTWLERRPDDTLALLYQAGLYTVLLNRSEAVATYGRILELDPDYDVARLRLAMVLMDDQKSAQAVSHLRYVRQRQPENPMVGVQLARCLYALGQGDDAKQLLDEVLRQQPAFSPALAERGLIALYHEGTVDAAEAWLREALARDPTDHQSLYNLAVCQLRKGNTTGGEETTQVMKKLEADVHRLQTILTTDLAQKPHHPRLHTELGQVLLDLGQVEPAMQWLNRTLEKDPGFVPAHRALAQYYERIGDREQAALHRRFLPTIQ